MTTDRASPLLSTVEVAAHLNCSVRSVRRLVRAGRLPALRLQRRLRFESAALDALRVTTPKEG